uniref:Uncharacterized protein n=1 Tax=Oryza rufipogon TaxID=4529 RepID=A0A0E0R3X4_ORYRU
MADCRIGSSAQAGSCCCVRWVVIGHGESWEVEWRGSRWAAGLVPPTLCGPQQRRRWWSRCFALKFEAWQIADASTNHNDSMSERTIPPPVSSHGEDFAEVVVVRHGETSANALCIIQGQTDIELNEAGRQQAVMPVAVYSSDLKRAAETAQTIATACNVSNLVLSPALRERHMGDLHGLKFDDAVRSKPDAYKAFSSEDRSQEIPGGGESLDQLSERCVSYLNTIAGKHKGERVIVVSHGASIEELCRHADPTSSVRRRIPNTSICVFNISGSTGHWILERFGDVAHLNEDDFP